MPDVLEQYVREALSRSGLTPSRARGQHFLIDDGVLATVIRAAELDGSEIVLEIGPGLGTLTRSLAARCFRLHAYELDATLIRYLQGWVLPETRNVVLHDSAFHVYALEKLIAEAREAGRPLKVVTNLPYQISAAFLHGIVEHYADVALTVVMLQREVAQRVTAHASEPNFSSFSLYIQTFLETRWVCDVPADAFLPEPRVESAVIRLSPLPPERQPQPRDRELYFKLVEGAFRKRRKQLANAIQAAMPHLPMERIREALATAGLALNVRAQDVEMAAWVRLADALATGPADVQGQD
jgi:16S rRNA (adenine1518-N6/adenine1519-N6)-dimethyltransferase